jgi:hypothetical protein
MNQHAHLQDPAAAVQQQQQQPKASGQLATLPVAGNF